MVAEQHVPGTEFGELQLAIWKRQFEALRDGDRFFYANDPALALIERDYGISARRTLAQIIEDNTELDVRDDVFKLDGRPGLRAARRRRRRHRAAPTLSLTLGAPADLRRVRPGRREGLHGDADRDRDLDGRRRGADRSTTRRLANGAFALAQPLRVAFSRASWDAPTSNEAVTITFTQPIGATEPLRTGAYAAPLTFTLATTSP